MKEILSSLISSATMFLLKLIDVILTLLKFINIINSETYTSISKKIESDYFIQIEVFAVFLLLLIFFTRPKAFLFGFILFLVYYLSQDETTTRIIKSLKRIFRNKFK